MPQSARGMSTPPKVDMASTMKVLPAARATWPTAATSLRMPLVVSPWTMATWGDGGVLGQVLGHRVGRGAGVVGDLVEGVGHPGVAADVGPCAGHRPRWRR